MNSVLQEVMNVNKMPIAALRKKYQELFNTKAPLTASRRQLVPKITYQLQVLTFGGINSRTLKMIDDFNHGKVPAYVQRQKSHNASRRHCHCKRISRRNI